MTIDTQRARVTVTGRVDNGDGAPEMIRREYAGSFAALDDGFVLEYDETEPAAHVRLTCEGGHARMERDGETMSRMDFVPGKVLEAMYIMPEGAFDMSVMCLSLDLKQGAERGILRIAYRLMSGGELMSDNHLMVSYALC